MSLSAASVAVVVTSGERHEGKAGMVLFVCSVTARHSSNGRQANFAALNRGRHLYSAGRPSRWAMAQILVYYILGPFKFY